MSLHLLPLLFAFPNFALSVDVSTTRYCKCFSNGTLQGLATILGSQNVAQNILSTCNSFNSYCTAPPGSGCFRAVVYPLQDNLQSSIQFLPWPSFYVYQFCAPQQLAVQLAQAQPINPVNQLSGVNRCQQIRYQQPGLCYCDDADYCNAGVGARAAVSLLLASIVALYILCAA